MDPLVVIDGVPTNANQFRNLNPDDIDTISILRDAAATSIYGNRGANGVIIVKTKSGKYNSPMRFTYSATTGINTLPNHRYNLMDASEFLTLQKRLGVGDGATMSDAEIAAAETTDWKKQFFKPDMVTQHNLNTQFGGENASVYSSIGYTNQGGMVPSTNFQRMTFRNNITGKTSNGKFTYNGQVGLAWSRRNQLVQESNSGVNNNVIQNPLQGSLLGNPTTRPNQYQTGEQLWNAIGQNFDGGRFVYVLEDILRNYNVFSRIADTNIFASAQTNYKITDKWTVGNRTGVDYRISNSLYGRAPWSFLAIAVAEGEKTGETRPYGGFEDVGTTREVNFNSVTNTNYSFEFGSGHTIDLGAYLEYTKVHAMSSTQRKNGLDPRVWTMGTGNGYVAQILDGNTIRYSSVATAGKVDAGSLAYFATLDYDYEGKYGVSGVIRRDGTYRFIQDFRWGTFWSAAARWNIDKESFMEGTDFQMLKLRASYGTQGNQNVAAPNYGSNAMLVVPSLVRDVFDVGSVYNQGGGSFVLSNIGNPLLQWEEIAQGNIGLDFKTLKGRLEGNIDVYNKQTTKLFDQLLVSGINGQYSFYGNRGGIRNRGVEVLLRYALVNKDDTKLTVFANGSYNKNTITDLQVPVKTGSLINEVGGPVYQWNLVPYIGVNPDNGNMMFLAADGTHTEEPTEADRRATGKNFFPAYIGGFGFNLNYKGFFVDTLFSFQADYYRTDNQEYWAYLPSYATQGYNVSAHLLNAWTPENRYTDIARLDSQDRSSTSDRFLRDASFIRFKNLTVGYTLPKKFSDKAFVRSLKLFVQGENLALWTKEYNGFDPEGLGTFPLGGYPNPRTISIGTTIEF